MEHEPESDSTDRQDWLFIAIGSVLIAVAVAIPTVFMDGTAQTNSTGTVSLVIETPADLRNESVSLTPNMTVFDAVNATYPVEYTEYDFGYLITSIDGLAQNDSHAWLYSVNGEEAMKAANNYPLNESDTIRFRYTAEHPEGE